MDRKTHESFQYCHVWFFEYHCCCKCNTISIHTLQTCNMELPASAAPLYSKTNSIGLNSGAWGGNHNMMIANLFQNQSSRTLFSFPTWFGALSSTSTSPGSKILHHDCSFNIFCKFFCGVCSIVNPKPHRISVAIDPTKSSYCIHILKVWIDCYVWNLSCQQIASNQPVEKICSLQTFHLQALHILDREWTEPWHTQLLCGGFEAGIYLYQPEPNLASQTPPWLEKNLGKTKKLWLLYISSSKVEKPLFITWKAMTGLLQI